MRDDSAESGESAKQTTAPGKSGETREVGGSATDETVGHKRELVTRAPHKCHVSREVIGGQSVAGHNVTTSVALPMLARTVAVCRPLRRPTIPAACAPRALSTVSKVSAIELWYHKSVRTLDNGKREDGAVVKWAAQLDNGKWCLFSDRVPLDEEPLNGIVDQKPMDFSLKALYTKDALEAAFYPPGPIIEIDGMDAQKVDELIEEGYTRIEPRVSSGTISPSGAWEGIANTHGCSHRAGIQAHRGGG